MPTRGIRRGDTLIGYATPKNAPVYVDSDDSRLKIIPTGSGSSEVVIQEASGAGSVYTPTAAVVLTAAQSGLTVLLNASAGFAITLPAVAAGLRFRFVVGAAFASTNFTVITPALANLIQGGAIVNSVYVPAVDEDTISFVASAETPGDYVDMICDGTNWLVYAGVGALAGSITFTTAG